MLDDPEFMDPYIRASTVVLGNQFLDVVIKNMEALQLFLDPPKFKKLLNYAEAISIRYLIQTSINIDDILYQDYIWQVQ